MIEIEICGRKIGPAHPPFVIAEIGINHNGNLNKAIKMVDDAYYAGCECVKFQSHIIEDEMIPAAKSVIPANATISIWDIMTKCTLSEKEEQKLKNFVESKGMIYLCTPFSRASTNRLEKMNVCAYKIGSGECNNYPLIRHIASFRKPVILSTGMNNLSTIQPAVKILKGEGVPLALMHCTSIYPTPYEKVRLGAISELKKFFPGLVIGLSDHSLGIYTCLASITLGASILEKHFTSDKRWSGPDVPISINPKELKELIIGARAIHKALGGRKNILPDEQPTIDFAYGCIVSIKNIKCGEKLTQENIWIKRPGTGEIKAIHYENLLGKKAKVNIKKDTHIKWSNIAK